MKKQNQELKQAQNLTLTAKYAQLSKYQELSDFEVAIVAGGSAPMTSVGSSSNASLPTKLVQEA